MMNKRGKNSFYVKGIFVVLIALMIASVDMAVFTTPAKAGDAGAFIGGMVTSRVLSNMRDRRDIDAQRAHQEQQRMEMERQRSYQQQQQQVRQAAPAKKSVEQRLKELDSLAKKGYITPEEYKSRKKEILNDI